MHARDVALAAAREGVSELRTVDPDRTRRATGRAHGRGYGRAVRDPRLGDVQDPGGRRPTTTPTPSGSRSRVKGGVIDLIPGWRSQSSGHRLRAARGLPARPGTAVRDPPRRAGEHLARAGAARARPAVDHAARRRVRTARATSSRTSTRPPVTQPAPPRPPATATQRRKPSRTVIEADLATAPERVPRHRRSTR